MKKSLCLLACSLIAGTAATSAQNPFVDNPVKVNTDGTFFAGAPAQVVTNSSSSFRPYQAPSRASEPVDLVAFLVSSNRTVYPKGYMYSINPTTGAVKRACGSLMDAEKGFCQAGDKIYAIMGGVGGVARFPFSLGYNRLGWFESVPRNFFADETAQDPKTGEVFGVTKSGSTYYFSKLDYENCTVNQLRKYTSQNDRPFALGVTNDGRVYGVCYSGDLVKIDRTTGEPTVIGATGLTSSKSTGCIDPASNRFFVIANANNKSILYEINLETAKATQVRELTYTVNGSWASMHVPFTPRKNNEELQLPYSHRFDNADFMDSYWVYNLNDDERYWRYSDDYKTRTGAVYKAAGLPTSNAYDNEDNNKDWLMTPRFHVEKGKIYEISVDANCLNEPDFRPGRDVEELSVYIGNDRTPEAMTTCLIPTTRIRNSFHNDPQRLTAYYTATETGDKYLGIYDDSQYSAYVFVHTLSISAGQSSQMPRSPSFLALEPVKDENKAIIKVVAPTQDMGSNSLTTNVDIELSRNNVVIATKTNVAPGDSVIFDDTVDQAGIYSYSARSKSGDLNGQTCPAKSIFVGVDVPVISSGLSLQEPELGVAKLSWSKPLSGVSGYPLNTDDVTYTLLDQKDNVIATDLTDVTYTTTVCQPDTQVMTSFKIFAHTKAGQSETKTSSPRPFGTPLTFPVRESFTDTVATIPLGWKSPGVWANMFILSSPNDNMLGVDGDNGFIEYANSTGQNNITLAFPKFKLPESGHPGLCFYLYNPGNDDTKSNLELNLMCNENGTSWSVLRDPVSYLCNYEPGWHRIKVDLSNYLGRELRFNLLFQYNNFIFNYLDCFSFGEIYTNDLAVSYLHVDENEANDTYDITVSVFNEADNTLPYKLTIKLGDELLGIQTSQGIKAATYDQYKVEVPRSKVTGPTELKAIIDCDGDENPANNQRTLMLKQEATGIGSITSGNGKVETARYSVDGRQLPANAKGMMIVRYSDGSAAKVVR